MTSEASDFFLIDRLVINAVTEVREVNLSLFAMLVWLGSGKERSAAKQRQRGKSGWIIQKRLKLFIDSIAAFSYLPIRLMSMIGIILPSLVFYSIMLVVTYLAVGVPPEGWMLLVVIVLLVGRTLMAMLGILGEYLWRALNETRRRPRYNIEQATR